MVRFSSFYATCALLLAATFAQGGPLASTTTTTTGVTTLTLTSTSRTTTTKRSPIVTVTKPSTTTLAKVSTKIRTSIRTSTLVLSKTSTQTSVRTMTVRSTTTKASPVVTLTQPSTSTKTQKSRTTVTATSTRTLHETSSSTITRDRKSTVYLDGTVTVQASVITVTSLVTSLPSAPTGSSGSGSGSASGSSGSGSDSSGSDSSGSGSDSGSGSGVSSIPAGALPAGSYYATGDCGGTYADFQYLELDRYDFLYRATLEECTAAAYDAQHAYATVILLYGRGCFVSGPFDISAGNQLPSDSFLRIWDRACFDDPNSTAGSQSGSAADSSSGAGSSSGVGSGSSAGSSSEADSGSAGSSGDDSASSSGSSDGSASGPPTVPARALQEGTYHRTGACGLDFADYEHMRLHQWDYIPAVSIEECAATAQDGDMHSYAQMIAIHPNGCFIVDSFDITEGELLPTDIFMPVYDMSCFGVAPIVVPDTSLQPGTYTSVGGCGAQLADYSTMRLNHYEYRPEITLEQCAATAQDGNHDYATMIIPLASEGGCFIVDQFDITEDVQQPSDQFLPVYDLSCVTPTPALRAGNYTSTDSCGQKLVDLQYTDFHQAASIHNVANVKACKAAAHSGKYNWATMILYWPDNHSCFLLDGFDITESTLFSSDQLLPLYDINCPL